MIPPYRFSIQAQAQEIDRRLAMLDAKLQTVATPSRFLPTFARKLAARFLDEYKSPLKRLLESPCRYPFVHGQVHHAGFYQFPYGFSYRIHAEEIQNVACFHVK